MSATQTTTEPLPPLTGRQAKFIDEFLACGIASEAWRVAYDKPDATRALAKREGYGVKSNPKVQAHIRARKAEADAQTAVNLAFLTEKALENAAEARLAGNHAAVVSSLQFVARLHGLLIDRREVTGTVSANVQVSGEISARAIVDAAGAQSPVLDSTATPVAELPEPTHAAVNT